LCGQAVIFDTGAEDIPKLLRDMGSHNAEDIVAEYQRRLQEVRNKRKSDRGLGALLRGVDPASTNMGAQALLPSATEIVGKAPTDVPKPKPERKKGGLFKALEAVNEERQVRCDPDSRPLPHVDTGISDAQAGEDARAPQQADAREESERTVEDALQRMNVSAFIAA
jgi:hypothetical protein